MRKLKKTLTALFLFMTVSVQAFAGEIPSAYAGRHTIYNFLATAFQPIGSIMYVWGGGHVGKNTVTIGLGSAWKDFYEQQGPDYDFHDYEYRYYDGLDCSGFVAWTLYNTLQTAGNNYGYVMKSTAMARNFASRGWGRYIARCPNQWLHPGDIMSTDGHVYIGIGMCSDGSRVLVHSSPPAAQITGTLAPSSPDPPETDENGRPLTDEEIEALTPEPDSEAVRLANYYMAKYWPQHHEKFPDHSRGKGYITDYDQMMWNVSGSVMSDPEGLQSMDAYHALKLLFNDDGLIMSLPRQENLIINGVGGSNRERKYPVFEYNCILYLPLTDEDCALLGLKAERSEDGSVKLTAAEGSGEYAPAQGIGPAYIGEPGPVVSFEDKSLSGGEDYPTVVCGDMTYLPMTSSVLDALGWQCDFLNGNIVINTGSVPN